MQIRSDIGDRAVGTIKKCIKLSSMSSGVYKKHVRVLRYKHQQGGVLLPRLLTPHLTFVIPSNENKVYCNIFLIHFCLQKADREIETLRLSYQIGSALASLDTKAQVSVSVLTGLKGQFGTSLQISW